MTNFYLSKWDGQLSNLGISEDIPVEDRNATVTEYGMGYERMQVIDEVLKNGSPFDAMEAVNYRQIYNAEYVKWTSEFLLRTGKPSTDLSYRLDMLNMKDYIDYRAKAMALCKKEDEDDAHGIRPDITPESHKTWQTVHSSTYNLDNLTLKVCSQGDFVHKYEFSLN